MINTVFFRGGAAQVARMLYNALNKTSEFTSYFAYGRGTKVTDKRTFKFASQLEVYLHTFLTRTTGLQGYGSYLSTRNLEKFILEKKIDLIHLHNLHGYYLNLSFIKFLGRLNIPIIWTLHDGWPITGRCTYLSGCDRWRKGCGNCPNLSWYPKTYFDSSAFMWKKKKEYFTFLKWNPIIVCPSQWLANKVKKSYLNKFRIKVIPNGVDVKIFKPKDKIKIREKLKIDPCKKVILFVATDLKNKRKGVKYFFESLNYIRTDNLVVITIGEKINLSQKIVVNLKQLGYIHDKNLLSDIYNIADVFCITSLDENFPTTVLESMACGTPVVGFKVGGIPEQVKENCGILVTSKDTEALGKALETLISNDQMQKEFGANCQKRVLENYTIDKFLDKYIKLYRELLTYSN
ncbi:glycosyltransferase [Candidatus Aerophobetes bacterium]|nr:glycosyltransferase [Candidatus Aerophobetes bacterium]